MWNMKGEIFIGVQWVDDDVNFADLLISVGALGSVVVKASRTVSGSIPDDVTGDFFRSYRQNHLLLGRFSL